MTGKGLTVEARKQRLVQLLHVGRSKLGMDEETYRSLIGNVSKDPARTSSKDLSLQEMEIVLTRMQQAGFSVKPRRPQTRKLADDEQSKLIRHLWLRLHELGAVRDPSEQAMASFVSRQTKIQALQWLSSAQASRVIEGLKKWVARTEQGDDK